MSTENSNESGRDGNPAARAGADLDLSDAMVDAVIAHLEDRESYDTSMWVEMQFMERVLGDLSPHRGDLEYRLNSSDSPVYRPEGLSDEQLRAVALALRCQARQANGQPPLTPEQEAEWRFEAPFYPPRRHKGRRGERIREWVVPTVDDERRVAAYLNSNYPDIVKYSRDVFRHNSRIPGEEYSKLGVSDWYFAARIDEALDQIIDLEPFQYFEPSAVEKIAKKIASEEI